MRLELNECAYLGQMIKNQTGLSLFKCITVPLKGNESETLKAKGLFIDDKLVSKPLKVIAGATISARLVLNDGKYLVEKYTYYQPELDSMTAVINDAGTLSIEMPNSANELSKDIVEFTGISAVKRTDIEAVFSYGELQVLLTLLDLYRQNRLLEMAGFEAKPHAITLDKLVEALQKPFGSSIVQLLAKHYELKRPTSDEIETAIEGLNQKRCFNGNEGLALNESYKALAEMMLIPEYTMLLEQYEVNPTGNLTVTSAFVLSSGIRNHLCFTFNDESIELSSLSSHQVLQMAENFLWVNR